MVKLTEALAAERRKRQQDTADTSSKLQIGRAVLEALAERLNAEPLPGWAFVIEGQAIRILRIKAGVRSQLGTWTVDQQMRLMSGEQMTEWITSESYTRVVDEAVQITAQLIVEAEAADAVKLEKLEDGSHGIVELPSRF